MTTPKRRTLAIREIANNVLTDMTFLCNRCSCDSMLSLFDIVNDVNDDGGGGGVDDDVLGRIDDVL